MKRKKKKRHNIKKQPDIMKDSLKTQNKDDNNMDENDALNVQELKTENDIEKCLNELPELKKERKYNAIMERVLSLFNAGHITSDLMLELAQIYYNTQDYARAATWATNAFKHDNNIAALLFLARIYSADDKMNKMAETLDLLLKNEVEKFSAEQLKIIDDLLFYIELSYETEEINTKFPNIALWMNDDAINKKQYLPDESNTATTDSSIEKISPQENAEENISETQEVATNKLNLADILLRISTGAVLADAEIIFLQEQDTAAIIDLVTTLQTSLSKKILLYNFIAAVYYEIDAKEKTIIMLKAALAIDDQDDLILKNLGYVFYTQGDFVKAFTVLRAISRKDFMVCELLKKCAHTD